MGNGAGGIAALLPCVCVLAALLVPALWALAMYNSLVRARQHVREAWAQIDVELKRRHDLIPNLVETVKGYAKHEQETLELALAARNAAAEEHAGPAAQARDENQMARAVGRLLAVAEAYPDLKADRHFLELQHELSNTEDRIQRVRRFYNGNVRDLNTKVQVFPTSLFAGLFGFRQAEYFEIDPAMRRPVRVDLEHN
ncbi:MAG: LemA family protein [Phycisphaeraceae bacterium]